MACVLHINVAGNTWWGKTATGWSPLPDPGRGPVWVVTDLTEENFVEITVPRIFGADRDRYVERQLANRFPESSFRVALAPQRTGSIMARLAPAVQTLTAVEPADRITAALASLQVPVAGVWSTSMLLAQLGQKRSLPAHLLMVLCQPSGMRIVFLKDRAPVLTRLVATAHTAADQAAEILRTVRHLENTRVIERGNKRFAALLMGTPQGLAPLLAADRLDALEPSTLRRLSSTPNWQHVLFDVVCKNPPGQMAPLVTRASYVARQVRQGAAAACALSLVAAVAATASNVGALIRDQHERAQLQATAQQLDAQLAEVDVSIQGFGISPEILRRALAVDSDEIASAPDLETDLVVLSRVVGGVVGARVKNLQWRVLESGEAGCVKLGLSAQTAAPAPASEQPAGPARRVELLMAVVLAQDAGPRLRLQQVSDISTGLGRMPGVTVMQDPVVSLRDGDLSAGGTQAETDRDLAWCAVLHGVVTPPPQRRSGAP